MSRIPSRPRAELQSEQQEAYDKLSKIADDSFGDNNAIFKYKDEQGGFIGPFPFCLAEPEAGVVFLDLATKLAKIPLSKTARETAILTCGAHFKAAYELYAHGAVAEKSGLTRMQVDAITTGKKPEDFDAACSTAYDAALHLASKPGRLPQALWDACVKHLGYESTIGLVHYVGYYAYVSIVLNATNAKAPA